VRAPITLLSCGAGDHTTSTRAASTLSSARPVAIFFLRSGAGGPLRP
jgi:hypothetical protein